MIALPLAKGRPLLNGNEIEKLDLSIPKESLNVQILNNGIPVQGISLFTVHLTHGMPNPMKMVN